MFEEGVTIHSLTGRQSRCLKDLGCCSWPFLSSFCTRKLMEWKRQCRKSKRVMEIYFHFPGHKG
eukprot:10524.XXX_253543_253812_1 [CDS] Oithona nana genome sequencing.